MCHRSRVRAQTCSVVNKIYELILHIGQVFDDYDIIVSYKSYFQLMHCVAGWLISFLHIESILAVKLIKDHNQISESIVVMLYYFM